MVIVDDSNISQLLEGLEKLFQGGQQFARPLTPTEPAAEFGPEGTYTPPIHEAWYNLGGFTLTSPNPRHPKGHMGLDMSCSAGTPVYPMAPGIVSSVGTDHDGGNVVWVNHGNDLSSYYAHLSTVKAQKGDKVDTNTVIATVGNTGNAAGGFPHLHFGVKEHGGWVDPAKYFSVPKYNPDYARNPTKYMNWWASEDAKQEAQAFNMKDHLAERRLAFSREVDKLLKIATAYEKLTTLG